MGLSITEIRARIKGLSIEAALDELRDIDAAVDAHMAMYPDIDEVDALAAILSKGGESDPGPDGYDTSFENSTRSLMELVAFYDESGPRSDPNGDYLCGTCQLRKEPGACLYVNGTISMETGGCQIYVIGTALPAVFALKEKFTQEEVGYAERPEAKGFGCKRCSYATQAVAPDADGRKKWCRIWEVHVRKNACCAKHDGKDMEMPWQHQSSTDV